ncbi:MAG: tetratricopeptide repeat protein [bacterium]
MGSPATPPQPHAATPPLTPWVALPVALTLLATGLLWDPTTTTYGALKGPLLAAGALATVLTAAVFVTCKGAWSFDRLSALALALALWGGLSLLWSPSLAAGLSDLTPILAALCLLLGARVLLDGVGATWIVAAAIAVAGLGASMIAHLEALGSLDRISGSVGNTNHLAAYLAATVPASLWLALRTGARLPLIWRALTAVGVALPAVSAVVLTGCRSALLALTAGLIAAVVLSWRRRRSRRAGLVVLCAVAGVVLWVGVLSAGSTSSLRGRIYLARIAAELLGDRVVTGHGVGGFALRFPDAQAAHLAVHPEVRALWTNARTAHCEPLQALVELGLVGGVLLLLLGLEVLRRMIGGRDPPSGFHLAACSTLVIIAISSLSEGSLHTVPLIALAAVALAMLARSAPPERITSTQRSPWVAAALAFTCSAACVQLSRSYGADRLLGRSHLARRPQDQIALLRRATRLAPNQGRARFYLGLALERQGQLEGALACLRHSARDFHNLGTVLAMGNILMKQRHWASAAAQYRRAVRLNPRYAAAHHNLGLALRRLGEHRLASRSFRRAQQIWPGRWLEPWRIRAIRRLVRATEDPS